MTNNHPSPQAFGVPHNEWRKNQFETVQWIGENKSPLIVQAKPGSGKSAVGAALGHYGTVRALTHTLNLQQQYEAYDFEPLYGLAHYDCDFIPGVMANDCTYPEGMHQCPVSHACQYIIRRGIVSKARRQALSYAYFLKANWIWDHPTDFLYADEAHLIKDILIQSSTIELTPMELQRLQLPLYPSYMPENEFARKRVAAHYLNEILLELKREYMVLVDLPAETKKRSARIRAKIRRMANEISKIGSTIIHIEKTPEYFYVKWDSKMFKLIPLTARPYFRHMFINQWPHKAILTSATIGNVETFARELGLKSYKYMDVPSNFSPEQMPVYDLGGPRLSHGLSQAGWFEWGRLIAKHINDLPKSWSGIIHVSSRKQASDLAETLSRLGLQDRVFIPEGEGTLAKITNWRRRKEKVPNTLAIAYSFHMGLDAPDDEINIVAKIPFATLDDFGMALLRFDETVYRYNAALLTEQASGRIRRGNDEDYEAPGEPARKFVAIADSNFSRVESEFSPHFQECIKPI